MLFIIYYSKGDQNHIIKAFTQPVKYVIVMTKSIYSSFNPVSLSFNLVLLEE